MVRRMAGFLIGSCKDCYKIYIQFLMGLAVRRARMLMTDSWA